MLCGSPAACRELDRHPCCTPLSCIRRIRLGVKVLHDVANGIRSRSTACQSVLLWQFWGQETACWSAEEGRGASHMGQWGKGPVGSLTTRVVLCGEGVVSQPHLPSLSLGFWMQAAIPTALSYGTRTVKLRVQHVRSWMTSGEQVQRERLVRPPVSYG